MVFKFDLHIHSAYSPDGSMSVERILELSRKKELSGIAICDHNTLDGFIRAAEKAPDDLLVVPAAEYSTDRGHMLAYFVMKDANRAGLIKRAKGLFDFNELEDFVHREGGLLFAAHPYRRPAANLDGALPKLDGIEVFNARNVYKDFEANNQAVNLCIRSGLSFSAGSDAHEPYELGNAYRIFKTERAPALEELKKMMLCPSGGYFGRLSPLTAQGTSAFRKCLRVKNYKGAFKSLMKTGYGVLYDATFCLDPENAREACGMYCSIEILREESV